MNIIPIAPFVRLRNSYPCRHPVGGPSSSGPSRWLALCGRPSTWYARGNEALYGHVCEECWAGFDADEQERYAGEGERNA